MNENTQSKGILAKVCEVAEHVKTMHVPTAGMFELKTMNDWQDYAKNLAPSDQLFNELIYEFETTFLIADTGSGKSIAAVQIAEHVSGGRQAEGFRPINASRRTLLVDLEMSPKQQEKRYSGDGFTNHYRFSPNFYRVQLDSDKSLPDNLSFEDWLFQSIEELIISRNIQFLIIDNITWLGTELEKAKDAANLMKGLKKLRDKYKLTLLVLAHTPKRDATKPLVLNDLAGSKMLANFIDAAFVIGKSHSGSNIRYIKQLKQRNDDNIYHSENVMIFELVKPTNFLHFSFLQFGREDDHLKVLSMPDKEELRQNVLRIHKSGGVSMQEIADRLGTNKMQVSRILKTAKDNGGL